MIKEADCDNNNTDSIRRLKHSELIRAGVETLKGVELTHGHLSREEYTEYAKCSAFFLYQTYPDIFNRILKKELDLKLLDAVLLILKMIEDEAIDQHEGSVLVGRLLKTMYLDSAFKHADSMDKKGEQDAAAAAQLDQEIVHASKSEINCGTAISWRDFKLKTAAAAADAAAAAAADADRLL